MIAADGRRGVGPRPLTAPVTRPVTVGVAGLMLAGALVLVVPAGDAVGLSGGRESVRAATARRTSPTTRAVRRASTTAVPRTSTVATSATVPSATVPPLPPALPTPGDPTPTAVVPVAPASSASASSAPAVTAGAERHEVATARAVSLEVFAAADSNERVALLRSTIDAAGPLSLLVIGRAADRLHVLLPIRPNGSTGWVRASDVTVSEHPWRITIELTAFRLTLHRAGTPVATFPIGVGKGSTPTPGGKYYTKELLAPPNPNGGYGPYAYGLSGFSNVLTSFAGGSGVIGIHGTNRPDLIGQNVSSGCIRMRNEDITTLAKLLPLGVPVEIIE